MFKNLGNIIPPNCDLEKICIIDLSQEEPKSFSFEEIDCLSKAVARGLQVKNIKLNDKIAILSNNSVKFLATFFGAMRLGAIPVLVNNKLNNLQIQKILLDSESKILFTDQNCSFNLESIDYRDNFDSFLNFGNFESYEPTKDDTAFLLYTSGSYNDPKGVVVKHHTHLWAIYRNINYDKKWSSKRISLVAAPLYHANGLTTIEGSIAGYSTTVLLPNFNAIESIKAIEKYQINTIYCVPTMLSMMVQEDCIKKVDLSCVKQIRSASSHFSQKLSESVKLYFPNAKVFNNYGITEVGPALFGPHPTGIPRPMTSVGYPAEGIEYRIIDGILQIKSPSMMTSYYKKDSKECFTDDGFFITKDLFCRDANGFYYFLGRADDMFKCGGNSVFPSHVEEILESHTEVITAVVLGIEDEIKGHKPYAFVVTEKNAQITEEELKQYVLNLGPAYQHPRKIWFIDQFPLAGTNKIDKKLLKRIAIENLTNLK